LNPGTYILNGSQFPVETQAQVTGIGVTLVFTDSSGRYNYPRSTAMDITSSAVLNLQAPAANATVISAMA
jgi:hypothetical protein